ncbi:MAG: hypothetical protein AUF76_15310 [Acidobacteria bacterium 13_1_20CM_2_65_9]|nr:MAG: hypothetical protein AUF76_15310 [Acidobacteria bacterium 13_1_20CM_2_65_9]
MAPVSTLLSVCSVLRSTMLTLFSPPLLVKPLPPGANAMPCTRGVSAILPTILSVAVSMTTISVPCVTYSRLAAGSTAR